ncbi:MAG TPA: hypothetical protein VJM80_07485 [bacterium]|nr:hypothetical protein [bacterium]
MTLPFWFELITWLYRAIYLYIVVMMIGNMFREGTSLAKQIGYALVTVPFLLRVLGLK